MSKSKWLHNLSPNMLRIGMNIWPPFFGSGIKVTKISKDFRYVEVVLRMRWFNKNYVGTHFGGALFAMTDPFYMLMLIKNLGSKYIVWDKAAKIDFKKPAKGTVRAIFTFTPEELSAIEHCVEKNNKYVFDKPVNILNSNEEVVAVVTKTLYVKKKETAAKNK